MKDIFHKHLNEANSLAEIKLALIKVLEEIKTSRGVPRLGYVSGIVSSDGPEHIERNMEILKRHTEELRGAHDFPIFSPTDIFDETIFQKINAYGLPPGDFILFWREILGSGHITDIFLTPGWERSVGAKDEYEIAKKLGLAIHLK